MDKKNQQSTSAVQSIPNTSAMNNMPSTSATNNIPSTSMSSVASTTANGNKHLLKIPYSLEGIHIYQTYKIKLGNVYDPSKLWIIIHVEELELFTQQLTTEYNTQKQIIPTEELKKDLVCIVRTNDQFHRAVILNPSQPKAESIKVFMVDKGVFLNTTKDEIFYINEKHCKQPRFAIRACLYAIAPNNMDQIWLQHNLHFFLEMVGDYQCCALVEAIDFSHKIVFIDIERTSPYDQALKTSSISFLMQWHNNAIPAVPIKKTLKAIKERLTYEEIFPYLFPSFEELEEGAVPSSIWELNISKQNK